VSSGGALSGLGAGGRGGRGGGAGRAGSLDESTSTAELDAVGGARVVAVGVRVGRVGVGDLHRLDVHGEGSLGVVGLATSPLNGALAVVGVTTSPDTDAHTHGGLGVASTALGIGVVESANGGAVNGPDGLVLLPVHRVGVEGVLGVRHTGPSGAVIGGSVTLAEVVGLDLGSVAAKSLL
jgi:hypothetical protein